MEKQILRSAMSRTVTSASAKFTAQLKASAMYRIVSDVDFWYKFGITSDTVAASDVNAVFVPAGSVVFDSPTDMTGAGLAFLHVIRSAVDGTVNVAEVRIKGEVDEGAQ